jgi:glycosyltransferase involved in cell wall biosynthesis
MMPRSEAEESNAQNNKHGVNRNNNNNNNNNNAIRTTGFLNTPHEGTKLEFARGEQQRGRDVLLARLGFATPLFFTATLLSFVLYWGALLFPPFAVFFICAFISYGWFKGILYSFSALFIGVPRAHLYKTADWKQLGNDSRKKSPLLERTLGVSEEDGKPLGMAHPSSLGSVKEDYDTSATISKQRRNMDIPTWTSKLDNKEKRTLAEKFNDLRHVVIVPTYREPLNVLRKTLNTLVAQTCAKGKVIVVIATEKNDKEAIEKVEALIEEYSKNLLGLFYTVHEKISPAETDGKSSNVAWCARCVQHTILEKWNYVPEQILVTVCDADTYFDEQFCECLSYTHAQNMEPYNCTYQSAENEFPNIWMVPTLVRVKAVVDSINMLGMLSSKYAVPYPYVCYSQSLRTIMDVNGWDVDVVPDDFHHFMKCFFKKDGHFRLVPIFMLTGNNAQEHTNWFSAMRSRYRRAKRDAWGAIDLSYILSQWYQKRNVLDKHGAFMLFVDVIEHHVSWSSYFLTVMLGGMMSAWLNPELETYPFGIGIRAMALIAFGPILFATWAYIVCDFYVRMFLVQDRKYFEANSAPLWWQITSQVQWLLMPLADFIFAAVAALDAQLHMALWPKMSGYRVSKTVDRSNLEYKIAQRHIMPNGTWRNEPFLNNANINTNGGGSAMKSSSSNGLYHAIESDGSDARSERERNHGRGL